MRARESLKKISTLERVRINAALSYIKCLNCESKNIDVDIHNVIFCNDCGKDIISVDLFKNYYL